MGALEPIVFRPVGVVRCGLDERVAAPRQPAVSAADATIVLNAGMPAEDLLDGLETFSHVWVLYVFHRNGPREKPKVQPPRSDQKRGVFATRSPHRPNPLGLSLVEIVSIDGSVLHVRGVDMLDGTPVLDLKPYLPYADRAEHATSGWLDQPGTSPPRVRFEEQARATCAFFLERTGIDVARAVVTILEAGARPHAYRRIKVLPDGTSRLAWKSLRFTFAQVEDVVVVLSAASGYRPSELHGTAQGASSEAGGVDDLALHRSWFSC